MNFTDKVVLVTGGSSGIGAATAIRFAKEGANVVIVGRNQSKLDNVADECAKNGKKPLIIKADLSKDTEVKTIIEQTIDAYKGLDILINNAAMLGFGSILDGKLLESYDEVMAINLRAIINITTLAAPHIIKTKGNIINISGVGSELTHPVALMGYGISKSGLNYFTRGAARELASSGVRVNSISPGPVETPMIENSGCTFERIRAMTALDRISKADEIAELVLFLASEKATGITGSNIVSDNGMLLCNKHTLI